MPFIPATNCCELVVKQSSSGNDIFNVFHFEAADPLDELTLGIIANSAITSWIDNLKPLCHPDVFLNSIVATDLTTASSPQATRIPLTGGVGSRSGSVLTTGSALAVKKLTDLRGRSYRERTYWYGLTSSDLLSTDSFKLDVVADVIDGLTTFIDDIILDVGAGLLTEVVLSLISAGSPRLAGVMTPVVQRAADNSVDSMRRRLDGRGS